MTTTYMDLELPVVSSTLGPEWASDLNTALETVDSHDHSDGKGTPVTPAGMDINDDLDFDNNQAQNIKSVGLYSKLSSDTTHLGSLQRVGTNLWWVNSSGGAVQITNGSTIVSSGSGVISVSVVASYPYTILTSDAQALLIIDSASARTLTLPSAVTAMMVGVKDGGGLASTNNITIEPDGTDFIDGANNNYTIDEDYGCRFLLSDGVSKWYVI